MNTNWNWEKMAAYQFGMFEGLRPQFNLQYRSTTNPFWWKGFVNGTVDYWLMKKGLK